MWLSFDNDVFIKFCFIFDDSQNSQPALLICGCSADRTMLLLYSQLPRISFVLNDFPFDPYADTCLSMITTVEVSARQIEERQGERISGERYDFPIDNFQIWLCKFALFQFSWIYIWI